jgi:hypothetical protein
MRGVEPLVTPSSIDLSPLHVIAVVAIAMAIGLIGVGIRRFPLAYADELLDLWRDVGPRVAAVILRRRRGMPKTPWFCARCRSRNATSARRCYSCGASRETSEAPVPDAPPPGGASAGRTQRR